ncbi:MAG TPA: nitronate monooxygenase [Candidatus Dormibacteraeota bacterium]|nr:nitronate monooxygenase [Candidatus Dormibacteraeota bacterium]
MLHTSGNPSIIQGGMGAGVSNWRLARAVSALGQLGVVSGVALDQILARRLQDGDPGGHMRRALEHFPFRSVAERIWKAYYVPGGRAANEPYKTLPLHVKQGPRKLHALCIAANFVEVFLAREGHGNPVGINYLEKIQLPHLPSIYGALLAGVGYILMGAGIPVKIPDVLDRLVKHEPATYPLSVTGAQEGDDTTMTFVPRDFMEGDLPPLERPAFIAIVASNTLATTLVKRTNGRIDGFVIEGPTAGGHNAPPRGKLQLDETGDVVYGERDCVDLEKIRALGLPFWLAGGYGSPEKLREALAAGAAGVQMGTAFAFCAESGLRDDYKRALLEKALAGEARVSTDALASPTSFPFKVAHLEGTMSEDDVYAERTRICDLGYLREAYKAPSGRIGYRCAGEPTDLYVAKGGKIEDTVGRKCICNALVATIGLPQIREDGRVEAGIVTAGNDLTEIPRFLPPGGHAYTAADVIAKMAEAATPEGAPQSPVAY